jgi:hypothetical protein
MKLAKEPNESSTLSSTPFSGFQFSKILTNPLPEISSQPGVMINGNGSFWSRATDSHTRYYANHPSELKISEIKIFIKEKLQAR